MPIYRCTVPQGSLSPDQKRQLATEFADVHCALTNGTPRKFVHVVFEEIPEGHSFSGGQPSTVARTVGLIRSGRSQETRSALVAGLTDIWRRVTDLEDADILVALHEVRPRDVMEWGAFLPEDGQEAEWVAQHGLAAQGVTAT